MENTQLKKVLVTGGNAGIGYALCKQLVQEHNCYVYMGSRNAERGQKAIDEMPEACKGKVEVLVVDVSKEDSVKAAAATLSQILGDSKLYALVNNAGVGPTVPNDDIIKTNVWGVKWMTENFIPLIDATSGRIVNVGSGMGTGFAKKQSQEDLTSIWLNQDLTWEKLQEKYESLLPDQKDKPIECYSMSKTVLATYTAMTAKQHPNLCISSVSPGFVDTAFTKSFPGDKITPEEATNSTRHCLFSDLGGSGWYYGSDGKRAAIHRSRNPGDPEFDGKIVFDSPDDQGDKVINS